ncbi:MAG: DUF2288 domain-containing protein [Pseudomonadota bacterium]
MSPDDTYFKLIEETASIRWADLARFFAQGRVLRVADGLNLPRVGAALAADDTAQVKTWQAAGELGPVSDKDAARWFAEDKSVWAVTIAPFVLVQASRKT